MPRKSRYSTGVQFGILGAVTLDRLVCPNLRLFIVLLVKRMPHQKAPPECRTVRELSIQDSSRQIDLAPYRAEENMENTSNILTVKEVADILRCSKAHVHNAIHGKVQGLPKLTHLTMGRRKLVRRDWLEQWLESNKTR
jgi:excisionase family DNA binding protein